MRCWADNGVWPRVLEVLRTELLIKIDVTALSPDSTSVKVHPDGTGALKKGPQSIGKNRGGWNTKIHGTVANATTPVAFQLSPGSCHDDSEARLLIPMLGECFCNNGISLLMDKAYEGDEVRSAAIFKGLTPVVPPKSNRKEPREYDKKLYQRRNEAERYFRRVFTV